MRLLSSAVAWIALYLVLAISPLVAAVVGDTPEGRGFWTELSVALGFVGLALLALQFVVSARSSGIDGPFGHDIVLRFHRHMGVVGMLAVLAHPLILFVTGAAPWALLNVVEAPWRARFGVLSVAALLVVVATSLWRKRLRIRYEVWRILHDALSFVVVLAALVHVELVGHYVAGWWRQALWALMSSTVLGLLVWVRVVKPLLLRRRPWRLVEVVERAEDVWSLVLEPVGHDGLSFEPGQFAWLTVGRSPLRITEHPFSISSSAEEPRRVEVTIKRAGDFTATVGRLEPGTRVHLDGPYGVFTSARHESAGFLFVAGGIGITPIMSMLRTLAALGDPRRMALVYANPDESSIVFRAELEELATQLDLQVVHVLERPPEDWEGPSGFVDRDVLAAALRERPDRLQCFLCGPVPMVESVSDDLLALGVPLERVHHEQFEFV
jgi:predicted ferric reductase